MIFNRAEHLDEGEVHLVNSLLENLIGKPKTICQQIAAENQFEYLDSWDNKMGFVKEKTDKYIILSLHFKDGMCDAYHVISKKTDQHWVGSRFFDSITVKELGIIKRKK